MRGDTGSEAFEIVNPSGASPMLLICDHASNAVPPDYHRLGLPPTAFQRHIAYDIGAAGVTRALASRLDAVAVLSRFSRLLIDPNRGEDDPTLVMKISDGALIPGNRHADELEVTRRLDRFYRPYDNAIAGEIARARARLGSDPALVSIHSFTRQLLGRPVRPWQITLLHRADGESARRLLALLREEGDLCVGDNVPYIGGVEGECLDRHGARGGLRHVLIEIRNDLIEGAEGQDAWADRLARLLPRVFPG